MRRHYKYKYLNLLAVVLLWATGYAGVYNGGFEIIEPNSPEPFDPPDGWERENYAAALEQFIPQPPQGSVINWKIDLGEGLKAVQGERFVVVSSDDYTPDPYLANIRQYVYVSAGQSIAGYYFFGTADYMPYDDYANIKLVPADSNSGLRDITVVSAEVSDVNDYGSMEGWEYFERTFSPGEAGVYYLTISVTDFSDAYYPSYIAVDGMTLCDQQPVGDINNDCRVDLADFSWMATDWLQDCNDPNYIADPNSNCYWGTDLDGNGPVDANDLMLMTDSWLDGQ